MRQNKPTKIGDILSGTIKNISNTQAPLYADTIKEAWLRAVGKEAGKHSVPASLRGKTIIIDVDSPIWIYQLTIKKGEIEKDLGRVLGQGGAIKIRLRAGEGRC